MPEERSDQLNQDYAEDGFQPPDLRPLRALADREELANARDRLSDGLCNSLPPDGPNAPLARDVVAALTEAGLTLHNCAPHHPRYRLGGVCPVPGGSQPDG